MTEWGVRPLVVILVGAQLVLVAALLVWASLGFPLPGAITGAPEARTATSTRGAGEASPATARDGRHCGDCRDRRAAGRRRRPTGARPAPHGRPLRRPRARLRCCASRSRATAGAPPARGACGCSPCGCAGCCRAGASSRSPATRGCATSSARSRVAARRSSSARTTTSRRGRSGSSAPTTARPARPRSWSSRARSPARRDARTDRPVRFVLFDGEEEPAGCANFAQCALRGSKAYAKRHGDGDAASCCSTTSPRSTA